MFTKTGNSFLAPEHYAAGIGKALRNELGSTHQATKTLMRWTNASERTVKNWLSGVSGPRGEHLVALVRHSDAAMAAFLLMADRQHVVTTIELPVLRQRLTMKTSYLTEELEQLRECFELAEHDLMPASADHAPYLGQKTFLRSQCSPVCPQCLAQEEVAREAWSHLLVTACHTHQTELLSQCPQCAEPICLTRRALMHCDCGYDYRRANCAPESAFSAGLSALLENVDSPTRQALPAPLNQLNFEPLLPAFLLMLAKAQGRMEDQLPIKFRFGASSSYEDSVVVVGHLESLLGEWPQRFDATLEDLLCKSEGVSLAGRIGTWYRELFSTYATPSFDFLRERFKTQVAEYFDGRLGVSTRALMFGADNADAIHWFAAAEAARLLGVAPDILANLVITQQVDGRVHQEGKSRFVAVHRSTLDQLAADRASYLSATEARQRLRDAAAAVS